MPQQRIFAHMVPFENSAAAFQFISLLFQLLDIRCVGRWCQVCAVKRVMYCCVTSGVLKGEVCEPYSENNSRKIARKFVRCNTLSLHIYLYKWKLCRCAARCLYLSLSLCINPLVFLRYYHQLRICCRGCAVADRSVSLLFQDVQLQIPTAPTQRQVLRTVVIRWVSFSV